MNAPGYVLPLPPSAPRSGHPFTRWLARSVLRLGGWKMEGAWPDVERVVVIAAPHSSMWDAWWGILAKIAMGVRVEFLAKKEAFFWPLGSILRAVGGFEVDRKSPAGVVEQLIARVKPGTRHWLVIAPEGTRKRVQKWKTGFWKIATGAQVPVVCAYFHYPDKTIGIGPALTMSGDLERDMATVREFYRPFQGKHRGTT
ncbi:MAG TPA: 1-acyl-sn-glycerol-3-phosphate acyltransferase [Pseudomonadota bacterium]|nr:1-acyl-sn-glycerol-3-phosphate acyltransferase [Xanthomonadales bacterium]HQW65035.1 1-acyl-sn-glycerol-3-phosphate acyltransferase [Pseudomonadota bacterium]HQX25907.1 1-acyl-sn-glycerol-3-phosphate acyltransferase [Pseudomonadota bacterium]HQY37166.1 1-acyl-sn-glycerol-3-phosphate acyltransferase [Pseudomonadota bacterium]HRA38820.1 1-acyl-sn-glycerol-3-phosphate acyltransferase [Pseudomonadota bacterium]